MENIGGEGNAVEGKQEPKQVAPATAAQEKKPNQAGISHPAETNGKIMPRRKYLRELLNEGPDRHIELLLTIAIATFAAFQLIITCSNNSSTSQQTERLLDSANRIDDAADSFTKSSADMSRSFNDAVQQLGAQAKEIEKSRKSSEAASQKALSDNRASRRLEDSPWLHVVGVVPNEFKDGSQAPYVQVTNSGKSPAFAVHALIAFTTVAATDPPPTFIFQEKNAKGEADFFPNPPTLDEIHTKGLINVSWVNAYRVGQRHAYIGVEMWYRDYWGTKHDDRACFYFQPESQQWVARKPDHCED